MSKKIVYFSQWMKVNHVQNVWLDFSIWVTGFVHLIWLAKSPWSLKCAIVIKHIIIDKTSKYELIFCRMCYVHFFAPCTSPVVGGKMVKIHQKMKNCPKINWLIRGAVTFKQICLCGVTIHNFTNQRSQTWNRKDHNICFKWIII